MNPKTIVFLTGPTAVGKTDVAIALAKKINAEIVSCDAMMVYKDVAIASNKPTRAQLKKVPHHLIDVISISKNFDVAAFSKKALACIKKIQKKNKIPLITGGSGMYMTVLLDGIFKEKTRDEAVRRKLARQAEKKGSDYLYKRLVKVDSTAAAKIHPHDQKRIIRALEVFLTTSKPISQLQKERKGLWGRFPVKIFALNRPREKLYQRINARVDQMFRLGIVREIKRMQKKKWSQTAQAILGVKEVEGYLRGEYNLSKARELLKMHTRRFAKRQLTWFRKDQRLQWIMLHDRATPIKVADRLLKILADD